MEIDDQDEKSKVQLLTKKKHADVQDCETYKKKREARLLVLKDRLKKYRHSITEGCGSFACPSSYCKSSLEQTIATLDGADEKEHSPSEKDLSKRTFTLFKKNTPLCSSHSPVSIDIFLDDFSKNLTAIKCKAVVTQVYRNLACYENSFLAQTIDEKELTLSEDTVSIDFKALNKFHNYIVSDEELFNIARKGLNANITAYSRQLSSKSRGHRASNQSKREDLQKLRVLLMLLENPLVLSYDPDSYDLLWKFGSCWTECKDEVKVKQLSLWVSHYDVDHLTTLKDKLMQYITIKYEEKRQTLSQKKQTLNFPHEILIWTMQIITPICIALGVIYHANLKKREKDKQNAINYCEFYNDSLNQAAVSNRVLTIVNWILYKQKKFDFFPWLLDAAAKAELLILDSKQNMAGTPPNRIVINRDKLIQDSLEQLQYLNGRQLRNKLKVAFRGEQGVDEGGVRKEYFTLLVREIMDVQYGMFYENPETRQFWFNSSSFTNKQEFELIGIIFGLAIYQGVIIEVPFPSLLFKKLLNFKLDYDDFKEFDPTMAKNLWELKTLSAEALESVGLTFIYSYTRYDENIVHELKEEGENIKVTPENVDEYIELTWRWKLMGSIQDKFDAFQQGFNIVVLPEILKMFWPEELELLVTGKKVYDWEELEETCQYDGGYTPQHKYIKSFWKLIHSLSDEQKRKFLAFCTGSDRVPVRGLSEVKLTIARNGAEDWKFPTSHTCFSILLLPEYSTYEILEKKLGIAIANYTGFGML